MKIIIETNIKKIPSCCRKCRYYSSGEWNWGVSNRNVGICSVLSKDYYTCDIVVSKERLKNCPLREVE